jgi:hypothetical protein
MNGKIGFGVDFVAVVEVASRMTTSPIEQLVKIVIPAIKALLVEWGLSIDETEQAMMLWAEGSNANQLDFQQCSKRLVDRLKDNEEARQMLITHLATIAYLDLVFTDSKKEYVTACGQALDMRASEISEYARQGAFFAYHLAQFGEACRARNREAGGK